MTTLCSLYLSRRAALLATFALTLTTACAFAPCASAQERAGSKAEAAQATEPATPPATPPYALFQSSTVTGTGNTITANNLPVVTSTGILYDNVTIQFDVAADGTLTVSSGYPQITKAPSVLVSNFEAGTYLAAGNGETIVVSGPGITNSGATEWSFATTSAGCVSQYSGAWYVGPIKNSLYYVRVKAAGVPLSGLSYGVGGAPSTCGNATWGANSLLGFSQTGNQLTIFSFTNNGVDQTEPVAQISYTKQ